MNALFSPLTLRGLTIPHRLWVSPMCQYSAVEGAVQEWHHVHLGAFAVGRAGLILTEATAVTPEGRISPEDAGMWNDAHMRAWAPIADFAHQQGVPLGIQLSHAGRKAATRAPFYSGPASLGLNEGVWPALAASALEFGDLPIPHEMTLPEIESLIHAFAHSAQRSVDAGFDVIEIHAAHGYLLHQFLSPLSNHREDCYGGNFANRIRLTLDIVKRVRGVIPESMPLFVRLSATDWIEGGWDLQQSVDLSLALQSEGVDLVDVSSGGIRPDQAVRPGPGYQVPFSREIGHAVNIPTGAVGLITDSRHAEKIVQDGDAHAVLMGRQFLREPRFALRAAEELGAGVRWPDQYLRAHR
jgi:2,4-dienoyl-CoA reductase-like NADH-dependent reductase (Old Yellow Enzyme family)